MFPEENYENAETHMKVRMGAIEREIKGAFDSDACKNYVQCPLKVDNPTLVNTNFTVPLTVPKVRESILC